MNSASHPTTGCLRMLAAYSLFVLMTIPGPVLGQEFPRDELDEALDALATERAQELNQAYYDYETALEELRREADRQERPELYTEQRGELRATLEDRVLRIERNYERRRADILLAHTGRGDQERPMAAEQRFDRPPDEGRPGVGRNRADYRLTQLEDELARAWAEFHREAEEARERARTDDSWDAYEATITRLENEYQQRIADIQSRQRALRFELERQRREQTREPRGADER